MLFREAVDIADGLVSSCGNPTDIRSIVPKRPPGRRHQCLTI